MSSGSNPVVTIRHFSSYTLEPIKVEIDEQKYGDMSNFAYSVACELGFASYRNIKDQLRIFEYLGLDLNIPKCGVEIKDFKDFQDGKIYVLTLTGKEALTKTDDGPQLHEEMWQFIMEKDDKEVVLKHKEGTEDDEDDDW